MFLLAVYYLALSGIYLCDHDVTPWCLLQGIVRYLHLRSWCFSLLFTTRHCQVFTSVILVLLLAVYYQVMSGIYLRDLDVSPCCWLLGVITQVSSTQLTGNGISRINHLHENLRACHAVCECSKSYQLTCSCWSLLCRLKNKMKMKTKHTQSSGAVWESRWTSRAPVPNKPTFLVMQTNALKKQQHTHTHKETQNAAPVWTDRVPRLLFRKG